jgi:hypothetical protein
MDINSLLGAMLSNNAVSGMGQATNASNQDVTNVLAAALPSLLGGALQQSQNQQTAQGFTQALTDHAQVDTSDIGSFMQNVDLDDGAKIIQHLLGGQTQQVEAQVAQQANVSPAKTNAILSAAAPLIMSMLGQALLSNVTGQKKKSKKQVQSVQSTANSSDVSGLLGALLGGSSKPAGPSVNLADGIDIGDVIGLMSMANGTQTSGKKKKQSANNTLDTISTVANILGKLVK